MTSLFIFLMKPRTTPEMPSGNPTEIPLKREYFEMIRSGRKRLELRVARPRFRNIVLGSRVTFTCGQDEITVTIKAIRPYGSLEEVIENEYVGRIAPDVPLRQIRERAERLFKKTDIERFGMLVFEF
jgi:ASC-1-like (ASCH) protein